MDLYVGTFQFRLLYRLEEFLCLQPDISIVGDAFLLVEELLLYRDGFFSEIIRINKIYLCSKKFLEYYLLKK